MTDTATPEDWATAQSWQEYTDRELKVARFLIDLSRLAVEHESARRYMDIRDSGQILGAQLMLVAFGYVPDRDTAHTIVHTAELGAGRWPDAGKNRNIWRARATNYLAAALRMRINREENGSDE